MKAAIHNPYLDTLGGGELYTMAVANALSKNGYRVDVEWSDAGIKGKLEKRFGIDLKDINFVSDINRGDGYDVCFWVSDGSIPALKSRCNLLHFQVPFSGVGGRNLLNRVKLSRIKHVVCNSKFTKKFIDKEFGVKSVVLYPPVDVTKFKPGKKEDVILYVGRFSKLLQHKGQETLIKAFKKLYDSGGKDYRLVLAGGVEIGAEGVTEKLHEMALGYPIKIVKSPDFRTLKKFYASAKFFWSASGYGVNEKKEPKRVEHFGITVVEAMASGAIPLICDVGGHREIVRNGGNGYLWEKEGQLLRETRKLIEDGKLLRKISLEAKKSADNYSYEKFEKELLALI